MDWDEIKKLSNGALGYQGSLRQHLDSTGLVNKGLTDSAADLLNLGAAGPKLLHLLDEVSRHKTLFKDANDVISQFREAQALSGMSEWQDAFARYKRDITDFNSRFELPEAVTLKGMIQEYQRDPAFDALERYHLESSQLSNALTAIGSPWLDVENKLRSITAFSEIQGIGNMLATLPTFTDQLNSVLRDELGDWRDEITWTDEVITDLSARRALYSGLGFNPDLTNFPVTAFQQSIEIAGLSQPPPLIALYEPPVPPSDDPEEEEGLLRTNVAHDWLQRLESQLRQFIDGLMTASYGASWARHRLPNKMYEKWVEKQDKAKSAGRPVRPLISYADFTDYIPIICRADNWREVFAPYFGRQEDVRESFQRMMMIRVDTAHSRIISQDDEFLLYVETRRIIKVITRVS